MSRLSLGVILLSLLSSTIAQEAPFTVLRPGPDDTLVLSPDAGANEIFIEWTVVPGTEDDPLLITLQRGENIDSLETIESVDGTVLNNGSYTWGGSDSVSLASGSDPSRARTGCNYTVRLSADGLIAFSRYFTIINEDDGPVTDGANCPAEDGVASPQFADPESNTAVLGGANSAGNGAGGGSGGNGGISTSTLAVAIVIPIVVLLIVFGLLLWFGIRRGWFAKLTEKRARKSSSPHLTHENTAGLQQPHHHPPPPPHEYAEKKVETAPSPAPAYAPTYAPVGELHADPRPYETGGTQVYQLEGDERDARFGDAQMRGQ